MSEIATVLFINALVIHPYTVRCRYNAVSLFTNTTILGRL